ncbi:MAG: AraC family transcriptional regulator [Burkholderiaceae bacterium]
MNSKHPRYDRPATGCLERSGTLRRQDWMTGHPVCDGISSLRAGLLRRAYARHRHDTYTIAVTGSGVQEFDYRGSVYRSLPGQVVVLHPDEPHDGRSGKPGGFTYCALNLDPACLSEVLGLLPFIDSPVFNDPVLAQLVTQAVAGTTDSVLEPLAADDLIQTIAVRLLAAASPKTANSRHRMMSEAVLMRLREFLDTHYTRVIPVSQLEYVSGESRYCIATNFRRRFGTSPYRYLLMRRVGFVRSRLPLAGSLGDLALAAGFADQAHMTRMFKSVVGFTPDGYARLWRAGAVNTYTNAYNQPRH